MYVPSSEPVSPRYIHINPLTNLVHLMVPIVGGQEISTDNTCQLTMASRDFFLGGARRELNAYKEALLFDIQLLKEGSQECDLKEERLEQINTYIDAIEAMRDNYCDAITALLSRPSNLYAIQLRPRKQDIFSGVVNPAFNINRTNDKGKPLSALYHALHTGLPTVTIASLNPRTALITATLKTLASSVAPTFEDIRRILGEQCRYLFDELTIDFTKAAQVTQGEMDKIKGIPSDPETPQMLAEVDQASIDILMGFTRETATPKNYIDALLGTCAVNMWEILPVPPFYSGEADESDEDKTERLSILTQFFLANVNIYCKARGLSSENFGVILDASDELSHELVTTLNTALSVGDDVETALCIFCNAHATEFGLSRPLNDAVDVKSIKQKFERCYRTVTANKIDNLQMDDFLILDLEATGKTALFVTHQGSICVDLAEIINARNIVDDLALEDDVDEVNASTPPDYFSRICADFMGHPAEIPHKNRSVASEIEVEIETLLSNIHDKQFKKLSKTVKEALNEAVRTAELKRSQTQLNQPNQPASSLSMSM